MRREAMNAQLVEFPRFLGENNRLPDSELRSQDGVYVRQAVNVRLTNRGTYERRDGYKKLFDGKKPSSLYSNGDRCFYLDDGTFYEIKVGQNLEFERVALKTGFRTDAELAYANTPLGVYFSDGLALYRVVGNRVATVNPIKPEAPFLKKIEGVLPKGNYIFAVTWVNEEGDESPPSHYAQIELTEPGGVEVVAYTPDGYKLNVYATNTNGTTLYLQTNTIFSAIILNNSKTIEPAEDAALPAGDLLGYFNGRLLSVKGPYLFYSEPFHLDRYNRATGFIGFSDKISVIMPTDEGLYVVADKTYFLEGRDITQQNFKEVLPYGGVFGTGCRGKDGEYCWMSPLGFIKANGMGEVENVQVKKVGVVQCERGNTIFVKQHGKEEFLTTLYRRPTDVTVGFTAAEREKAKTTHTTPNRLAAKDWFDAEILRKESQP